MMPNGGGNVYRAMAYYSLWLLYLHRYTPGLWWSPRLSPKTQRLHPLCPPRRPAVLPQHHLPPHPQCRPSSHEPWTKPAGRRCPMRKSWTNYVSAISLQWHVLLISTIHILSSLKVCQYRFPLCFCLLLGITLICVPLKKCLCYN